MSPRRLFPAATRVIALLSAAVVMPFASAAAQERVAEDTEGRDEWFWAMRSSPSGVRPYREMLVAVTEAVRRRSNTAFLASTPLSGAWRAIGPFGFVGDNGFFGSAPQLDAGRIVGVAPPRVAGGPFYIAAASGGVWKAPALGAGWTPLTDHMCTLNMGAITTDPVNPSIVYAGTGEYNTFSFGCGIMRSTNAGATWTVSNTGMVLSNGASTMVGALLVEKTGAGSTTTSTVVAATASGIYRSTNSGSSWTQIIAGAPSSLVSTKPGTMFAGMNDFSTASRRGLWKSSNSGLTWTQITNPAGLSTSTIGRVELAVSAASPDKVFLLVADRTNRGLAGLYIYDDAAGTWTHPAATGVTMAGQGRGDFGLQSEYDLTIAVDPRNANRIYVAGVRAYLSTDGGATFKLMAMEIHCDWHSIVIDPLNPDILYAATDGGLFVSTDAGDTWIDRNAGLSIAQYYPGISLHPSGTHAMGGSQDNGTHLFAGSQYWDAFNGGDGGYTAINYLDPTVQYGESQWSQGPHLVRRKGTSFASINSGIGTADRAQFIPPLIMDPVVPTTLYFGTHKLYKTTNEGTQWTALAAGADLTKATGGSITTIAVARSDPQTIYVGSSDGYLQRSQDGGATFSPIVGGLPPGVITKIVVDPANPIHAFVTFQGYGSGTGHVWESTTQAPLWLNVSGNLPNIGVNSIAMIATGHYVVGTDIGLYQTVDGGVNWTTGPAGMPNVIVMDVVYQPTTNTVLVGTFGRGMFTFIAGGTPAVLRGDANADGTVNAADALLVQQALISTLPASTQIFPRGDANCNGSIDAADVVLILRKAVGLSTTGCVGTTA